MALNSPLQTTYLTEKQKKQQGEKGAVDEQTSTPIESDESAATAAPLNRTKKLPEAKSQEEPQEPIALTAAPSSSKKATNSGKGQAQVREFADFFHCDSLKYTNIALLNAIIHYLCSHCHECILS